jgi:hypothetical protein
MSNDHDKYRDPATNPFIRTEPDTAQLHLPLEPRAYDGAALAPYGPVAADLEAELARVEALEVDAGAGLKFKKMADGHWQTSDRRIVADLGADELQRLAAFLRSRAV